jgi:Glycosyltransferase
MPTIVQINTVINSGSTGRIAEEIGQAIIREGWKSYIAFGFEDRDSQSQKIRIGSKFDVKRHILLTKYFDRHGLGSKAATRELVDKLKAIQPDIIHLHNIHGYYLNYPILFEYLKESQIPVVWTLHDCWPFTGHCPYFSFIGCERWKTGCYRCPQKKAYPKSKLFDRSTLNYLQKKACFSAISENLYLVPVSDWLADIARLSFLKTAHIQRIHNGIDTTVFSPRPYQDRKQALASYQIQADFIILGVANRWEQRKGLDDFIQLADRLPKECKIVIVGLSERQRNRLLHPNIIGITRTENTNQLADLYSAADVFVNPTWEDNYPTTNLEAQACGTPVITYRTGGASESIIPGTGFIIPQGDLDKLLSGILSIKEKGKETFSQTCRDHALQQFPKADRYAEYIQLYNNILQRKEER